MPAIVPIGARVFIRRWSYGLLVSHADDVSTSCWGILLPYLDQFVRIAFLISNHSLSVCFVAGGALFVLHTCFPERIGRIGQAMAAHCGA